LGTTIHIFTLNGGVERIYQNIDGGRKKSPILHAMPPPPATSIRFPHQLESADELLAHEIERLHIERLQAGSDFVWVADEAVHKTHVVLVPVDSSVALKKMINPERLEPDQKKMGSNKKYSPFVEVDI
jgi:hypothetical protein